MKNEKLIAEIFDIVHDISDDEEKLLLILDFLKNGGLEDVPFEGGFFNDDGTRLDESKIPMPNKCLGCRKYLSDDWEDDMLCKLNRADQADDLDNFKCGAFEAL